MDTAVHDHLALMRARQRRHVEKDHSGSCGLAGAALISPIICQCRRCNSPVQTSQLLGASRWGGGIAEIHAPLTSLSLPFTAGRTQVVRSDGNKAACSLKERERERKEKEGRNALSLPARLIILRLSRLLDSLLSRKLLLPMPVICQRKVGMMGTGKVSEAAFSLSVSASTRPLSKNGVLCFCLLPSLVSFFMFCFLSFPRDRVIFPRHTHLHTPSAFCFHFLFFFSLLYT